MAVLSVADGLDVLERRTRAVRVVLIAYMAISFAEMLITAGEASGMIDVANGEPTPLNMLGGIVYLLFSIIFLTSVVVVAMWIYRAHANLQAAEIPGLEFSPGWAVGGYFVPFANLYQPLQAMRELWLHTVAQNDSFGPDSDSRLTIWWAAWIGGNILSNVSSRLVPISDSGMGNILDMVAVGSLIVAGWLLLRIVETVNTAQRNGPMLTYVFA